ncbi:MAG: methionyl-tRNA formyltransferase [Treponema sp.]|jgi:methionyl-tRNA formyltransferase|nr:methionyl-tRNA formyltransferase [Treponema sp.]
MAQSFHPSRPLRILFAGTPAIALPAFRMIAEGALAENPSWTLAGVLTNPDKPRGRSGRAEPSVIGLAAAALGETFTARKLAAPVLLKPDALKTKEREAAAALGADLLVAFAYGRIFGPKFLGLFPLGGINVHPSLLPKYRGASPIQEAILRGDTLTGVTIQRIALEMDSGNILARCEIRLTGREHTAALTETASREGADLLQRVLERIRQTGEGVLKGTPQEGEASYCSLITKESGLIDWTRSARDIDAQIRAYNPWPLTRTCHNGQILHILKAENQDPPHTVPAPCPGRVLGIDKKSGILIQTGRGILAVSLLQYQNRNALPWQNFLNGARDFIGSCLTGGS